VNVWKNPDLSVETIVRPDGTISLPLLGDLKAAGRAPGQLREASYRLLTCLSPAPSPLPPTVTP